MISFSRNSRSIIANWWWTVDKVLLTLVTVIILIGIFLNFSASPAVANRIGVGSFHFIKRQLLFLPVTYMLMVFLSMQNLKTIRRVAILGYTVTILLMIATLSGARKPKAPHAGSTSSASRCNRPNSSSPVLPLSLPGCLTASRNIAIFRATFSPPACLPSR